MSIFNQQAKNAEGQAPRRRNVGCLGGCLLFVAIYLITSAVIGLVMSSMMDTSTVELKENTVYRLQLKGTLIEQAQEENPFADLMNMMPYSAYASETTVGLDDILSNIRLAKNDDRIRGIWLDGAGRSGMRCSISNPAANGSSPLPRTTVRPITTSLRWRTVSVWTRRDK